ncbi:Methyltransferase [Spraguea lophii 42_110]|uniref:Methyltransferase n=1 Tax=Spraguea lophii (strain 42_110) TaxID=1358809 RepID=S7W903_SPRLO|nr:Methyltransferase [Spraguea lophii 42_110]
MYFLVIDHKDHAKVSCLDILLSNEYIDTNRKDKIAFLVSKKVKFDFPTFYTSSYLEISTLKYEKYGKFLLINRQLHSIELKFLQKNYDLIMEKKFIEGEKRVPTHVIIYERKPTLAIEKQFGITFQWDPKLTMFSKGNINERNRMGEIGQKDYIKIFNNNDRKDTNFIFLDMFTGIGYFTIPYLKNNPLAKAIVCDINTNSITALKNNIKLNKISNDIMIHNGDCKEIIKPNIADRISMGLIPDCSHRLPQAMIACKNEGIIHYHTLSQYNYKEVIQNIAKENLIEYNIIKIVKVKEYSPKNQHIVVDIQIFKK